MAKSAQLWRAEPVLPSKPCKTSSGNGSKKASASLALPAAAPGVRLRATMGIKRTTGFPALAIGFLHIDLHILVALIAVTTVSRGRFGCQSMSANHAINLAMG